MGVLCGADVNIGESGKLHGEGGSGWEKEGKAVKPFKPGKAEMGLERVDCVVVDEADVLFGMSFYKF